MNSNAKGTYLVVSMREIETGNIHSCIEHFDKHFNFPTGGSKSTDDLSLAHRKIDLLKDVLELDAGGIRACTLVCFYHFILLFVQSCFSKVFAFVLLAHLYTLIKLNQVEQMLKALEI